MTAIQELMYDCFDVSRVLIIAPKRVAEDTWTREHEKWDHLKDLRISKVLGTEQQRLSALSADADIYVIGRDNVKWLVETYQRRKKWPFDMIVVDELSSFKNPQAQRFRALRKVLPHTKRVVGLTGTPSPNSLMDLWAEIYLLDRGERRIPRSVFPAGGSKWLHHIQVGADTRSAGDYREKNQRYLHQHERRRLPAAAEANRQCDSREAVRLRDGSI